MQTRRRRSGDTRESIKHCMSLATVFSRMGRSEGNRKENFPAEMRTVLESCQAELRREGRADLAESLGRDVDRQNGGIRMLLSNLAGVMDAAPQSQAVLRAFDAILEAAERYAEERSGEGSVRLGNEVMLEREEVI